jgi:REP element-mobilizing transposase RayT
MPQSLSMIYIHAIFSTKNREPTLAEAWRDELFNVLGGIANNLGCQSLVVGGVSDHVHMLFQLGRTTTLADVMGQCKGRSSSWINETRNPRRPFHWQAGYAAFSASQSTVDAVKTYIRNQPEHHKTQSFQDEVRQWLRQYGVAWDERYIWD